MLLKIKRKILGQNINSRFAKTQLITVEILSYVDPLQTLFDLLYLRQKINMATNNIIIKTITKTQLPSEQTNVSVVFNLEKNTVIPR